MRLVLSMSREKDATTEPTQPRRDQAARDELSFAYSEAVRISRAHEETVDGLNAKAGNLVGFSGAVLAILVATAPIDDTASLLRLALTAVSLVTVLGGIGASARAFSPQPFLRTPSLDGLMERYRRRESVETMMIHFLASHVDNGKKNRNRIDRQGNWLRRSVSLLVFGLVASGAGAATDAIGALFAR